MKVQIESGGRIRTLQGLRRAARDRRSVVCPASMCFHGPIPAAFMINLQGTILCGLLNSGMYLYPKPNRRKSK